MHTGFWWRDMRKREHLEDLAIDGWIVLKWSSMKWDGLRTRTVAGSCECGNELLGFIKCKEFVD